jgi:serine kinase of HPr protein (carbohydrate metabolism regulator)
LFKGVSLLNAKKIIDEFKLKIINKNKCDTNRKINGTTIHRFGLELSG